MTLYFQECAESPPSIDPIHTAMLALDASADTSTESDDPVDKYLPEPQSFQAVLKLDDDIRSAWLHAIKMEIKNLIDHGTFILGQKPHVDELIIPVKLVLKAKQTASGKLEKRKARLVARGDMEKRRIKKTKAKYQQQLLKQREENTKKVKKTNTIPIEIPQPFEDTWSPCASSRGVKLLISKTCAFRRILKGADFIGAYLQAKVIGRHFIILPLYLADYFPEYAKYFGVPLLLDKGTVFSDASWQDCPDTGRSTVGYMIFHNGALIEANSTMPTPIAMSTSEAEYMAACSATMATAHIRMLLYDMTYLGTKQWRESSQRLPTTPSVLMIDNEATVQIAKNGKLTRKTRHIERRFHFVRQGQQDGTHQLYWIPCDSQLADILTKTQTSSKIDPHLNKIFCTLPDHLLSPSPISTEI